MKKVLANIIIFFLCFVGAENTCLSLNDTNYNCTPQEQKRKFNHKENKNLIEGSNIQMKILADKAEYHFPEPVTIQLFLFKPYPVSGAKVLAKVTSPSGNVFDLLFSEDLLVGPTLPSSGSYVAIIYDLKEDGPYLINVRANDNDGQAFFSTSFGEDTSEIKNSNAERLQNVEPFEISKMFYIKVSGYEGAAGLPPLKVTTLYASLDLENRVTLTWQTPINIGSSGSFEIRYATKCKQLRTNWIEAQLLIRGKYTSKGGETQSYKAGVMGKGTFCFSVISENKKGIRSKPSNQYIVNLE